MYLLEEVLEVLDPLEAVPPEEAHGEEGHEVITLREVTGMDTA